MQRFVLAFPLALLACTNQVEDVAEAAKIEPLMSLAACLLAGRHLPAVNRDMKSRIPSVLGQSTMRRALLSLPLISLPLALPAHADGGRPGIDTPGIDPVREARLPPLILEDWYQAKGVQPSAEKALLAPFVPPQATRLEFVPFQRRAQGYLKYNDRIRDGIDLYAGSVREAIADKQWDTVLERVKRGVKGVGSDKDGRRKNKPGAPVRGGIGACALFTSTIVQSENTDITPANLLCRYLANEVYFMLDDIETAAKNSDYEAAAAAWTRGKDFFNAFLTIINFNVNPDFGNKFPLIETTL